MLYNGGMKTFKIENITKDEINSIKEWTEDSSVIKQYMWGLTDNVVAKKHSENLFGLFDKYSSNVKNNKILYRGMAIPDDLFQAMGYNLLKKGSSYTPDDKAISSFSVSKKIAYDFAIDGEHKNKVILKIKSHNQDMLDITNISTVAKEEETILTKNIWYNVKHIKKRTVGGVKWLLIILQKR